jgi:hypothetical protein
VRDHPKWRWCWHTRARGHRYSLRRTRAGLVSAAVRITARVVGLVQFSNTVVQDDIDRPLGYLVLTPALARVLLAAGTSSGISFYGLQFHNGPGDAAARTPTALALRAE